MFDLIYEHNATKKKGVVTGLTDSGTRLAFVFEGFSFPDEVPYGEITCYLIYNGRDDVTYDLKNDILESVLSTEEGDIQLKYLIPEIFLMRYGEVESDAVYREKNTEYYYYKK